MIKELTYIEKRRINYHAFRYAKQNVKDGVWSEYAAGMYLDLVYAEPGFFRDLLKGVSYE